MPGAAAPVSNVTRIWNPLLRWILGSRTTFANFLHSVICNKPSVEEGTATSIWPMSPPYPWLMAKTYVSPRSGDKQLVEIQRAMNLITLTLSWLHLGQPRVAPRAVRLGRKLSKAQWKVVRRLEPYLEPLVAAGEVGPKEMGRTAAKMESLDILLGSLHDYAGGAGLASMCRGSTFRGLVPQSSSESHLLPGPELERGCVIGSYAGDDVFGAKEIETGRLSFPQGRPMFDPRPFLDEEHRVCYEDPTSLADEMLMEGKTPPRVQVRASPFETKKLVEFLDNHGRLSLVAGEKVNLDRCCGAFAIIKDAEKDRLIVDARPANEVEPTLTSWCKTLGSVSALLQLEIQPQNFLYLSGTDLRDFYYCFRVTAARSARNTLRLPLPIPFARRLSCFEPGMEKSRLVYPSLNTMAMGDNNAVELGQMSHVNLGLSARAFTPSELLCAHSRGPRGSLAAGIVIDDVLIAEQAPPSAGDTLTEGEYRLNLLCEKYQQEGLTAHPAKTFYKATEAEVWGASIDGKKGWCRASLKRLIPLMEVTARTARAGVATVHLLEIIAGAWVAILQVRRRMLSLLQYIYAAQVDRPRNSIIRLAAPLVAELWTLVVLGPIAVADLRAQTLGRVFLADASSDCLGVVASDVDQDFGRELHRHCLSRGCWSKLLSPWKAFLKEHEDLDIEAEIPSGVPLVCHPLWVALAEHLQFRCILRKKVLRRRHINLLEVEAVLRLEARLAERFAGTRYLLGSDSQVALAALLKGRSSSKKINDLLRSSLATHLGAGLTGSYGYVPSKSNVADDPTRDRAVRLANEPSPQWLSLALAGDYSMMDEWLAELGYDPLTVAKLPFPPDVSRSKTAVAQHVSHLREVQKPERLKGFDEKWAAGPTVENVGSSVSVEKDPVSHPVLVNGKETRGEHEEPGSHDKIDRRGKKEMEKPKQAVGSLVERRVAPPASDQKSAPEKTCPASLRSCLDRRVSSPWRENSKAPLLSGAQRALLQRFPGGQFYGPDGKRAAADFKVQRRGFLDLYTGAGGTARHLAKKYKTWVLCFEYEHSPSEDLLKTAVQASILQMIDAGCFLGMGAAPECGSFSRAVAPPVRSRDYPTGLPVLTANMEKKVAIGNEHASFMLEAVESCLGADIGYYVENPDGSFLWLQPAWVAKGYALMERSYRFDQCRYGAAWRKRTRLATNLEFSGRRDLCLGGHEHVHLRGRSSFHRLNWTRVAQVYPLKLCRCMADALATRAGLRAVGIRHGRLDRAGCAKVTNGRIGEAAYPGPRARQVGPRDADELLDAALVEPLTRRLQDRVWGAFLAWIQSTFSATAAEEMFRCPSLIVLVLQRYGVELYARGSPIYEYRHLLVFAQQRMPLIKPVIAAAWQILSKWESLQPLVHRVPLPEILYKAMFSIGYNWGWLRWCACLMLAYEGISRIGEVLRAHRRDLVLPSDNDDFEHLVAYLKIANPKSRKRGKGRVQHLRVDNPIAVKFLETVFAELHPACRLFPLSPSAFRYRWEKTLDRLEMPRPMRPTPASVRGGGAILAYRRGEPINNIMWKMRIVQQQTLESYLQETVADSLIAKLPDHCRQKIRTAAKFFAFAFQSSST